MSFIWPPYGAIIHPEDATMSIGEIIAATRLKEKLEEDRMNQLWKERYECAGELGAVMAKQLAWEEEARALPCVSELCALPAESYLGSILDPHAISDSLLQLMNDLLTDDALLDHTSACDKLMHMTTSLPDLTSALPALTPVVPSSIHASGVDFHDASNNLKVDFHTIVAYTLPTFLVIGDTILHTPCFTLLGLLCLAASHTSLHEILSCDLPPDLGAFVLRPSVSAEFHTSLTEVLSCDLTPDILMHDSYFVGFTLCLGTTDPYLLMQELKGGGLHVVFLEFPTFMTLLFTWISSQYLRVFIRSFMMIIVDENFSFKSLKRFRCQVVSFLHFSY